MTLETKARPHQQPLELRAEIGRFLSTFEQFKRANDDRLDALEKGKRDDAVLNEKIARIDRALHEQKSALDRMALDQRCPSKGEAARAPDERKAAFQRYMRAGDAALLNALETKALVAGTDAEGGYLAPDQTERLIAAAVRSISPIRQIASVVEIGAGVFKKPVAKTEAAAGWVAETGARSQTATPELASIDFPAMELYAMPAASQTLLDDAVVDVEAWLAEEVQGEFAQQEGAAFISGNGTTAPKGFLSYDKIAEASHEFGKIGYIATGAAGAFAETNPADKLLDLVYTPRQAFRQNGRFVMNRSTLSVIRKLKDGDGNYLWRPSAEAGEPSTLFGYPVTEAEDMPSIAANSFSIAFGDFQRGYLIVDRMGVRVLRDPYSAKPYVLFYTTKRVGGGVQNFDAIKLLKFAAS
jgi:HK97 family phage major capsid protein